MPYKPENPMVVQSDQTILLEVDNPFYEAARDQLVRFAELQKSPEHIHTYRITPLSLWNAAASGLSASEVTTTLSRFNKYEVPQNIQAEVAEYISRFGKLKLCRMGDDLVLSSIEPYMIKEIWHNKEVRPYLKELVDEGTILVKARFRGHLKQNLIKFGLPVEDLAGYVIGAPLSLAMRSRTRGGSEFHLRPYQQEAVEVFHAGGGLAGGSGVIVLPCGAGKTIIGMAAIEKLQTQALILVTNITALRQWQQELLDKTTLSASQIGEYSGEKKEVLPVTIATYNILTYRRSRQEDFPHFNLFDRQN